MIREALEYLFKQSSDARKAGIRILKTPNSMPGVIHTVGIDVNGIYEMQSLDYALAPCNYLARTIHGLKDFMVYGFPATDGFEWHIFIGEKKITAHRIQLDENETDAGREYALFPSASLNLTETPAWTWAKNPPPQAPKALITFIQKHFTGKSSPPTGLLDINDLIPLLRSLRVSTSKDMKVNTNVSNESVGLDVQKNLMMGEYKELPECIAVPVQMFKEDDTQSVIRMYLSFDYEGGQIILSPVEADLIACEDKTNTAMADMLKVDYVNVSMVSMQYPSNNGQGSIE